MNPATQSRIPKRQALLLLLALAAPCIVLTAFGLLAARQESRLAEQRTGEERLRRLTQFRAELLAELDRIRHQAAAGRPHRAVVLTAGVRGGIVELPFDPGEESMALRRALNGPGYGARVREAERLEFIERNLAAAAAEGGRALAEARRPVERAYAALLLARIDARAGRLKESRAHYQNVFESPAELQDEYGIPLALYAVEPLLDGGMARDEAGRLLGRLLTDALRLSTPAVARMRDVANRVDAGSLQAATNRLLNEREQAETLRADLPRMLERLQSGDADWLPYGEPLWLIGQEGGALVAVSADRLQTPGVRLVRGKEGEALGDGLPGLRAVIQAAPVSTGALGRIFLPLALVFVVGLTLVAGVLLWRDMERSTRLADMRSHFISSVSHELRTPLTSIRMFAESMRLDDEMDAEMRAQCLDTVLHESERLSRLVDNVLHFARIEQGRAVYDLQPAELDGIVESTLRSFRPVAEQAGFRLEVSVAPDLPPVLADRDAMEQALLNLLGNAMKYSAESRKILLRASEEAGCAAIRVMDHGIGIALEEQSRIFERFYRAAAVEGGPAPGAGLGLTLVDHIAKAHGGSIAVESEPGAGSTFTLRIPLAPRRAMIPEHA